jgi:ABC-type glycerol-3-phosphate transport system substrate-binding protein
MKKIFSLLAVRICIVLLTMGFLSGCGVFSGKTKIKISSWGDLNENAILVSEISDFEKIHPDIEVELQRVPANEYVTKLLTQIGGGVAPDVIFVEANNFGDFYFRHALESLNPYIAADHINLSDYYPQVIDRFSMDNQVYVMPRDTSPICVIYYNKNIFDECHVPYPTDDWTWDDFLATAQKVTKQDADGNVTRWGFVDDWPMAENWIYGAGGSYVDNAKHPTKWILATDPNALKGLQFRADLMLKYKVMMPPTANAAMGGMGNSDRFANGAAAMFMSGYWKVPNFRDIKSFKWDIVMQPKSPDGHRGFPTGGSGYGILSSSKHKQACWELIKYVSGVEGAKKMAATGLSVPVMMSVANSPIFLDDQPPQNKKMILDAVQYSVYNPLCVNWSEVRDGIVGPEFDRIWNGTETPEEAMEKIKPMLEKNPPIYQ